MLRARERMYSITLLLGLCLLQPAAATSTLLSVRSASGKLLTLSPLLGQNLPLFATRPAATPEWCQQQVESIGSEVFVVQSGWDVDLCESAIAAAEQHASWQSGRHHLYPTTDVPAADLPNGMGETALALAQQTLLPAIAASFDVDVASLHFKDMFVAKYTPDGQPGLGSHTDGSAFSFNVLLSAQSRFEGGGTQLDALGDTPVQLNQGECLIHRGSNRHRGCPVLAGSRYIMVGFVESGGAACSARRGGGSAEASDAASTSEATSMSEAAEASELRVLTVVTRPFGMVVEVDEGDATPCAMIAAVQEGGGAWAAGVRVGDCLRAASRHEDERPDAPTLVSFDGLCFDDAMSALAGLGAASVDLVVERFI